LHTSTIKALDKYLLINLNIWNINWKDMILFYTYICCFKEPWLLDRGNC